MGHAAYETDHRIKEMRDQMDDNPSTVNDEQAEDPAARYRRIAVIAVGVAAVAGVGYLVYRRMRRPSRTEQVQKMLVDLLDHLPDSVREAPAEVGSRLRNPRPAVDRIRHEAERAAAAIKQRLAS